KGSVIFKCPSCGKADITRSFHARELGTRYTCPACSFEGPN
ncbi:RNA-binding protein, partial [Candidatus Woesearchaeota archaeon]|nr:RNA-binding protein [Candidatus Woesearchaeota archaeon]